MSKKRKNVIMLLGILSVMFITTGLALTVYSYTKDGTTENSIKSGSITFWYDEQERQGNSIGIEDALPMSDTDGKQQTNAFNFRITSKTSSSMSIPYTITLRQKSGTDNIGNIVKVYLAKTTGIDAAVNTEQEVVTSLFSSLEDITKNGYSEKVLYKTEVPKNSSNYEQNYRLKMWIDESTDYSNSNYTDKTFTVTVNVYSEGISSNSSNLSFSQMILADNTLIAAQPTFSTSSSYSQDASGLYSMNVTNGYGGGNGTTYYYRGAINNNYVQFGTWEADYYIGYSQYNYSSIYSSLAECQNSQFYNLNCTKYRSEGDPMIWRIVRINEDGTIRIVLDDFVGDTFGNLKGDNYEGMYYSNSDAKTDLDNWFNNSTLDKSKVATGNYFCESANLAVMAGYTEEPGTTLMSVYNNQYVPTFSCVIDQNNHQYVNASVGLLTFDDVMAAGAGVDVPNNEFYLYKENEFAYTMTPSGVCAGLTDEPTGMEWIILFNGSLSGADLGGFRYRPVINLKADVTATGSGTSADPYVVQ